MRAKFINKENSISEYGIENIDFSPATRWFQDEPKVMYRIKTKKAVDFKSDDDTELAHFKQTCFKHDIKFTETKVKMNEALKFVEKIHPCAKCIKDILKYQGKPEDQRKSKIMYSEENLENLEDEKIKNIWRELHHPQGRAW